jgi:hypothetical protein
MANYRFTNNTSRIRLFVNGVLYLKGKPVITQGRRLIDACKALNLPHVIG